MVMKSTASSPEPSPNSRELKYKGVRKRKWGKWVSEIRLPNSRERIWLGSFDSPEKAARAFDAAQICLRGPSAANLNFPDNPRHVDGAATGLSPAEIQLVAARFANSDGHPPPPPATEEVASVSTESVSVSVSASASEGGVQWEGGDVSFNDGPHPHPFTNYYDFNPLARLGSGNNYEAEFGFGDFYTPEDSGSLDYYEFDQWNGSGCENSFLWNF